MARVIVVTSGKGGVGKTTTTSNLGMSLARLGHNTLLLDADTGLRNLDLLLGLENRVFFTGSDVLNKKCKLEQAIIEDKRQPKLSFFPLCSIHGSNPSIIGEEVEELISMVSNKYDFILIDSPAGIDASFQNAIRMANEAIIVVTPEVSSIRDADRVIGILITHGIKNNKLLINRIRPKMIRNDEMMSMKDIQNILGLPIIGAIPESEQIIIASNRGEPIVLEKKLSAVGMAFENTARRLEGQEVAFLDLGNIEAKNLVRRVLCKFLVKKPKEIK